MLKFFLSRYKDNVKLNVNYRNNDDDDDDDDEHDNDSNENDSDESRIYIEKISDRQWDLVIDKAKLNDIGDYKCKIHNSEAITKVRSKRNTLEIAKTNLYFNSFNLNSQAFVTSI